MSFSQKNWLKAKGILSNLVMASHYGIDIPAYFDLLTKQQVFPQRSTLKLMGMYKYNWLVQLIFFWEESNGKRKVEVQTISSPKPEYYADLGKSVLEYQREYLKEQEEKFNMKPKGNVLIVAPVIKELSDDLIDQIIEIMENYHKELKEKQKNGTN